jgi:aminoglycoside phosphotransferase family enzyme/predicted kinase
MDLQQLIEALSEPSAYPHPVSGVEVCHTHSSVVFLAGNFAYKIKKPVKMGFLDFSTLEKRRHFCAEEIRLNRRLAPAVYLGVVPVTRKGTGVVLGAHGKVVEWAVKMERLPEEATLQSRLGRGEVDLDLVEALARKIACFHAQADAGEPISVFGRFEVVARNARENFAQAAAWVGTTISRAVYDRLRALTEKALACLRPQIERRATRDVPRDTHGDLRLDHVYHFPDRNPPDDLIIIDCIEFNERFRFADPVADMAFLVMDLSFRGRPDLAHAFSEAYFRISGDDEGRALLPFYAAYRAAVRAKVEGFELSEKEIPEAEQAAALARARAHWLLALGELEEPGRKPCLVLVGGLPGTGKSTLARGLAERAAFSLIHSDAVRKELAGLAAAGSGKVSASFGEGIYSSAWNERTYRECLRRVDTLLLEGKRVVVDAGFRDERTRRIFLDAACGWGVPGVLLLCQADPETARARLQARRDDVSDADWSIYQRLAEGWQKPSFLGDQRLCEMPANASREQTLAWAVQALHTKNLCD